MLLYRLISQSTSSASSALSASPTSSASTSATRIMLSTVSQARGGSRRSQCTCVCAPARGVLLLVVPVLKDTTSQTGLISHVRIASALLIEFAYSVPEPVEIGSANTTNTPTYAEE